MKTRWLSFHDRKWLTLKRPLTGANSMMIEGNNVNEIWAYKAWLKVDIPDKQFSKKFDETASKNLVPGMQQFADKDEFFDLIHQLTAKAAMEDAL